MPVFNGVPALQTGQWTGSGAFGTDTVAKKFYVYYSGQWRSYVDSIYKLNDSSFVVRRGTLSDTVRLRLGAGGGGGGSPSTSDYNLKVSGSDLNTNKAFQTISINSGSPNMNKASGFNGFLNLTQNAVLSFTNIQDGDYITIVVIMGSGGPYTLTLPSAGSIQLKQNTGDTTTITGVYRNSAYSFHSDYPFSLTGDVTGSGQSPVSTTIAADAVSFSKMQNISSPRLIGRYSAGSGDPQELKIGSGLSVSNDSLLVASASGFNILNNSNHRMLEATGNSNEANALSDFTHPATGIVDLTASDTYIRGITAAGTTLLNIDASGGLTVWSPTSGTRVFKVNASGEVWIGPNVQSFTDAGAYIFQTSGGNIYHGNMNQMRLSNSIDGDTYTVWENTDNSGGFIHYNVKDFKIGTNGTDKWMFINSGGKLAINSTVTTDSTLYVNGSADIGTNTAIGGKLKVGDVSLINDTTTYKVLTIDASGNVRKSNWLGSGAGLTINNNANNRVLTANGGSTSIEGEANLTFDGSALSVTGTINMNNNNITSLLDPVNPQDAATKAYTDALSSGVQFKTSVGFATTAALAANTYNNGAGTITMNAVGTVTIDGHSTVLNDEVLIKDEGTQSHNGIYKVTTQGTGGVAGVFTRRTDYDAGSEVTAGTTTFVTGGTSLSNTQWTQTTTGAITLGTTSLIFSQTGAGSIANNSVSNAKLAQMAAHTFKGNNTGSTADPIDLTVSQLKTDLSLDNVENTALSTWPGSSNIITVGTVTNGTWNGITIAGQYGGTGVANTGKTLTMSGNIVLGSSTNTLSILTSANTSVTLPTSGTLVNTSVATLSSLASIGTITTGVWNGTLIDGQYGGTGVNNSGKTITLANNLTTSGNFALTLTSTNTTNATLPAGTVTLVDLSSAQTLTTKAITPRVTTTASSATPTPTASTDDVYTVTALAANATFGSPGTGVEGQGLIVRIKDNGTARTLAWNAIYRASSDLALPTTTIISKTLYLKFIYNNTDSKWDLVSVLNNF